MSLEDVNYTFPDIDNYGRKDTNIKAFDNDVFNLHIICICI